MSEEAGDDFARYVVEERRLSRLPVWAQNEFVRMRRQLDTLIRERQLVIAGAGGANERGLVLDDPRNIRGPGIHSQFLSGRFMVGIDDGDYISFRREDDSGVYVTSGWRAMSIEPRSGNAVVIRPK